MLNHPPIGRMMALATRYEVSIQVASSVDADRLPAMCGSATFATLVSSTSMKVANITVKAMIHGLMCLLGVQRLHLPGGVRQIGTRLVIAVQRRNLVIVSARQFVLRVHHFDVIGHAGLEAVA